MAMQIETFVFNPFGENTYLVYDDTTLEAVIIDPGCYSKQEQSVLHNFITHYQLKPIRLLNTHCHLDHVAGNQFIYQQYGLLPEFHINELAYLKKAKERAMFYGFDFEESPMPQKFLTENEEIKFGRYTLKVLEAFGHSAGGLVFYEETQKKMFVGDVIFSGSIGRTDLEGGDYDTLISNIKQKLLLFDDDYTIYSGHGPTTTIGKERRNNPFLV